MARFLLAAQAGMGHLNPLLTLGRRLMSRGHEVAFAVGGPKSVEELITSQGFELLPLPMFPAGLGFALLPHTTGFIETALAFKLFTSGVMTQAPAVRRFLSERPGYTVVADFACPAVYYAAESLGLPFATVYHAGLGYRGPGIPPFGSGLPIGEQLGWKGKLYDFLGRMVGGAIRKSLSRARHRLGLAGEAPEDFWSSPWLTMVLTADQVEAPRFPMSPETFMIGPCFDDRRPQAEAFPFERLASDRPRLYVSLGTVFNNKPRVFRRILEAFADGAVQLVVSAGGAYERLRADGCPPHVLLFPRVPQVEILSRVDAVISHGGNNTVNETLAAGKPLLVLPVGGEQRDNASRVVYLGAGLRSTLGARPDEVRAQVERLLRESGFGARARACAQVLARTDGVQVGTRLVEHLAEAGAPIRRSVGSPLTLTPDQPMPWETGKR